VRACRIRTNGGLSAKPVGSGSFEIKLTHQRYRLQLSIRGSIIALTFHPGTANASVDM
jgi:hypothetical protein